LFEDFDLWPFCSNGHTNGHNGVAKIYKTGKAKAAEGEGCPRCGCIVYAAEQKLARGRVRIASYPYFTSTNTYLVRH
jgi:hypothetical protein